MTDEAHARQVAEIEAVVADLMAAPATLEAVQARAECVTSFNPAGDSYQRYARSQDMAIDHICGNPSCTNIAHMRVVAWSHNRGKR